MASTTTINVSSGLKIEVSINQWGKPGVNCRSKRYDGSFKNFFVTESQWRKIESTVKEVNMVIAKISKSAEPANIRIPAGEKKIFLLEKRGNPSSLKITLHTLKDGEIQIGLDCRIGGLSEWRAFTKSRTSVSNALSEIHPRTPTRETANTKQYKWFALKKDGDGEVYEAECWNYTMALAEGEAKREVNQNSFLKLTDICQIKYLSTTSQIRKCWLTIYETPVSLINLTF